jgi:hypothetical protein
LSSHGSEQTQRFGVPRSYRRQGGGEQPCGTRVAAQLQRVSRAYEPLLQGAESAFGT